MALGHAAYKTAVTLGSFVIAEVEDCTVNVNAVGADVTTLADMWAQEVPTCLDGTITGRLTWVLSTVIKHAKVAVSGGATTVFKVTKPTTHSASTLISGTGVWVGGQSYKAAAKGAVQQNFNYRILSATTVI